MPLSSKLNKIEKSIIVDVIGDGVTDNTGSIQSALNKAGAEQDKQQAKGLSGKSQVFLTAGTYKISSTLNVPNGVTLIGETKSPPYPNRISGFRSNNNLFTGTEIVCTENFTGKHAISLGADNTSVENIILDGHSIPSGTCYSQINVTTAQGRWISTAFIKFPVNDPLDNRVASLKFDNIEIPYFRQGQYDEFQLQAIGGSGNYTYTLANGNTLPSGLTLSNSGLLSGTPSVFGTYYVSVQANDGANVITKSYPIGIILDEILTRDILPPTEIGRAHV